MTFEQVPTGPAGELLARVQSVAAGTPYRVRATRTGFDVLGDDGGLACRVQIVDEQARAFAVTDEAPGGDEARWLVATAAGQLGWTERRGTGERLGLLVALAGGGAVLVMVALVVVLLMRLL
ncbi:MAG TPA: hypothetical protein VF053_17895 [Streptosporangiales bacterium]